MSTDLSPDEQAAVRKAVAGLDADALEDLLQDLLDIDTPEDDPSTPGGDARFAAEARDVLLQVFDVSPVPIAPGPYTEDRLTDPLPPAYRHRLD